MAGMRRACLQSQQKGYLVFRFRVWIAAVTLVGFLAHATFGVGHDFAMAHAGAPILSLETALAEICSAAGGHAATPPAVPAAPSHAKKVAECPFCAPNGPGTALLPAGRPLLPPTDRPLLQLALSGTPASPRTLPVCPPSQGPPGIV